MSESVIVPGSKQALMKIIHKRKIIVLVVLFVAAWSMSAATFTALHEFSMLSLSTGNGDGANPESSVILSSNVLYGAAGYGGSNFSGTVFRLDSNGSNFIVLHEFSAGAYNPGLQVPTNKDGYAPEGDLVDLDGVLFGTAYYGGSGGVGALFKLNIDGTGFTNFHNFTASTYNSVNGLYTNADGASPSGGLLAVGNELYGTTFGGGTGSDGVIFAVTTSGTGFTNLHSFAPTTFNTNVAVYFYTNVDGAYPYDSLILVSNQLYGTAYQGGYGGAGVVFRVNPDGSGFTNLHNFAPLKFDLPDSSYSNRDGGFPYAPLVFYGGSLYGTTFYGGITGDGTIFRMSTNGGAFTNLYVFTYGDDGANPEAGLTLSGNTLYGTAENGGATGDGSVFQINTDGAGFKTLYSFSDTTQTNSAGDYTNSDGSSPYADVTLSGSTLYGTTMQGGLGAEGTIFALNLSSTVAPIPLNIQLIGANAVLTWSVPGFSLQSAASIAGPYSTLTGALSPHTNSVSGDQQFFRLISN